MHLHHLLLNWQMLKALPGQVIATLCTLRRHLPNQDIELIKPLIYAGLAQPHPNHDSIVNLTRILLI